ncbi:MAG TPA: cytochrome D1 domain-containing protein [Opitutaceae bacterium]|nr:cytochrome D1 domain-containing protein [Opitutaceae bacterium]
MLAKLAIRIGTFSITTLALSAALFAQTTPRESLLVLSKQDHTVAIVDPTTLKVLARIPVGNDPHEVIASPDGNTAYVSNYGGGAYNTLTAVDVALQTPLNTIDLGPLRGPHGLDFVGGKVWFTAEAAKAIGSYDPGSSKVDWILGTGQNRTHMIYVSPDAKRIITTNVSSGTVSIIESSGTRLSNAAANAAPSGPPREDWNETVVKVGNGSEGFDVSPDRKEIWVANAQDGTISIIDAAQRSVTLTLNANVPSANRLKFTPDGKRVFVSALRSPDVVVLDTATRKEIKRIPVSHGAAGIQMQPDGSRAFVACTPDNYVVVIDLKSLQVTAHIDAGGGPDGMAWGGHR